MTLTLLLLTLLPVHYGRSCRCSRSTLAIFLSVVHFQMVSFHRSRISHIPIPIRQNDIRNIRSRTFPKSFCSFRFAVWAFVRSVFGHNLKPPSPKQFKDDESHRTVIDRTEFSGLRESKLSILDTYIYNNKAKFQNG